MVKKYQNDRRKNNKTKNINNKTLQENCTIQRILKRINCCDGISNATSQYSMKKYSCYHATTTITARKKILSQCYHLDTCFQMLLSWHYLKMPPFKCQHPNIAIQQLLSHHYHPNATDPMLSSQCYRHDNTITDTCIPMLPSEHYHPDTTNLTTYCCIIRTGSQKHTICTYSFSDKLKQIFINGQKKIKIARCYSPNASIPMLPKTLNTSMLTIFSKAGKHK